MRSMAGAWCNLMTHSSAENVGGMNLGRFPHQLPTAQEVLWDCPTQVISLPLVILQPCPDGSNLVKSGMDPLSLTTELGDAWKRSEVIIETVSRIPIF
jgi:hypothetical protein